ncbi:MAG: NAD(P)-dependent alcohol dehydrogenase [Bacteroidales bacterium]
MFNVNAFAAYSATTPLAPFRFDRRDVLPHDVRIDILYCGVCHSDLHQVRSDWRGTVYPCVPGHEIVGRVTTVGADVAGFKPGDLAGVGCMVDSCRSCESCREGLEQYCERGSILTYNGKDAHLGGVTYGGYSQSIVVDEAFALHIPEGLDPAATAPLLCAGITTYSPLRHWNVGRGTRVGVVGLGGLGHMAVKLAHAMGAEVTLFTTSSGKATDARRLGADDVILSTDEVGMKRRRGYFDFILDTVSANHDLNAYLALLRRDGAVTLVGLPPEPAAVSAFYLIGKRVSLAGSAIGGIRETQEMLDFCAAKNIVSDIETIPIQKINEAYERMLRSDVRYRFVIDISSLA